MCHCCKWVHTIQHSSHNMAQHHLPENFNLENYSSGNGGGIEARLGCCKDNLTLCFLITSDNHKAV
jgi:hypothetical protein